MANKIRLAALYPGAIGYKDVFGEIDLDDAVAKGAVIRVIDESTGSPDKLVFDGDSWVGERPKFVKNDDDVAIPTADYVDVIAELFQAEVEAIVEEIDPAQPVMTVAATQASKRPMNLREKLTAARVAIESKNIDVLTQTVEEIKEATSGTARS